MLGIDVTRRSGCRIPTLRDPPEKREKDGRKKRERIDPAPHGDEKDGRAKDGSLHLQLGSIR
jgi:hypothetical protein